MLYYSSDKEREKEISLKIANKVFSTIEELYDNLITIGWCEMSTYSRKQWDVNTKCNGQCNATVLLVQEYFGGDIIEYDNPSTDKKMHYFNRVNGVDIDLTSRQFEHTLDYVSKNAKARFGLKKFEYEKSAYILKLRLGLIDNN